jgi:Ca-activated chloride channel family protein
MWNYRDRKMQALAEKGNGNHAYIDNLQEANKVLVYEFGGTLHTVAKDVKLQIEFNPAFAQAYRLVGYESRLLNREDFNEDTKDAGEMGAGHAVTAFYKVILIEEAPEPGYAKAPKTAIKEGLTPEGIRD